MIMRALAAIALIAAASTSFAQPRTWEIPNGVNTLEVNGYEVAYTARGSGPTILLVHGSMGDYRYFTATMAPFFEGNRVIVVSLRHYFPHRWDGKGGAFSMRQHVEDIAEFIRKLNTGPIHVVGHSRGGSLGLYLAARHPELLRSLTVAEGGGGMSFASEDPQAEPRARAAAQRTAEVLALFEQGKIDDGLVKFMEGNNSPGAWNLTAEPIREMLRDNVWTLKGEVLDQREPYSCDDARRIPVPVLLVGGEKSPARYGQVLDALQSCLQHFERAVIPGAAHSMPRQNPKGFADAISAFIAKY